MTEPLSDRLMARFEAAHAAGDRLGAEAAVAAMRAYADQLAATDPLAEQPTDAEKVAELRQELHGFGWWPEVPPDDDEAG